MQEAYSLYSYIVNLGKTLHPDVTKCDYILVENLISDHVLNNIPFLSRDVLIKQYENIILKKACETYSLTEEQIDHLLKLKYKKLTPPKAYYKEGMICCGDMKLTKISHKVVDFLIKKGWSIEHAAITTLNNLSLGNPSSLRFADKFYMTLFKMGFDYEAYIMPYRSVFYLNNKKVLPFFKEEFFTDTFSNASLVGKMTFMPLTTKFAVQSFREAKSKAALIEAAEKKIPTSILTLAFFDFYDKSSEHITTAVLKGEDYFWYSDTGITKPFADLTLILYNYGNKVNLDEILESIKTKKVKVTSSNEVSYEYALYNLTSEILKIIVYDTWKLSDKAFKIYREYLSNVSIRNPNLYGSFDHTLFLSLIEHLQNEGYFLDEDKINTIRELIVTFEPKDLDIEFYIQDDTLVINNEDIYIGDQIKGDIIDIVKVALYYKATGEDFYNVPESVFNSYKYIISIEGCATPFNYHAKGLVKWCSPYDQDIKFGSLGNFHANKPSFILQKVVTKSFINLIANSKSHIIVCTYYNNQSLKLKELLGLKNKVIQKVYPTSYLVFGKHKKYSSMIIIHFNGSENTGKNVKYTFPEWN